MASHLTLLPALGAAPSSKAATPKPAAREDDAFSSLVEASPAPARQSARTESPVAKTNAPAPNSARSGGNATETAASEAAIDPALVEETVAQDGESAETGLAEALLAALAAVVSAPEGEEMGSDLKDIEEALDQLAEALGLDLSSLVQQLTTLVEAAGGSVEGGEGELVAKLTDWLAKTLGTPADTLEPEIEAGLTRLVEAAKKLAQPLPTEPELAEPTLKLAEPVLTGKTAATTTETAPKSETADDDKLKSAAPEAALREAKPVEGSQNRPAQTPAVTPTAAGQGADAAVTPAPAQPMPADTLQMPTDSSAAAPRVVQTGYQTSQQQLNLPQIAFEMARQVEGGNSRFQIRLDPPELGRIDVKLDIDSNGQVHARLTVEKAETLDLMQRDQRALERALQQAGLDANKTNLEFSLKQNPFAGDQNERSGRDSGTADLGEGSGDDADTPPAVTLYRGALQASGLNIIA
ncbi:MAG: flagellar hook-length control protein FliK [Devosia sp.]|nr:flagellar hook-length control protein FliK [Devosia sp.]